MATEANETPPEETPGTDDSRTIEDRALEMGWVPEDQFKGDKSRFIPAKEYVERGESFIPFLQANNRRLEERFGDLSRQNSVLAGQINELAAENEELKKGQTKTNVEGLKAKRDELADELKIAREAGNTRREAELQGEIAEVNDQIREGEKSATQSTRRRAAGPSVEALNAPDYKAFAQQHPWYGVDRRKTALANAIGDEVRQANPHLTGKAFFDKVTEEIEKDPLLTTNERRNGTSRVEGGVRGTSQGGGSSGGKTFSDLPADARAACQTLSARLVGPNKKYKDMASWQAAYAAEYFKR